LSKKAYLLKNKLFRIIDANLNRSREGLRVCEDIARFILEDRKLTQQLKSLRHNIGRGAKGLYGQPMDLLESRNIFSDKGRFIKNKSKRKSYQELLIANFERAKESLRVLEETTKLLDEKTSLKFNHLRYTLYNLEKEAIDRLSALRNIR
jgi:thiamine-phosphate pyrophosphorylase